MKKIIITTRYDKIGKFKELRDNLDVKLSSLIEKLGYLPILLPNNIKNLNTYINRISPNGIILSGGGDPAKKDLRKINEKKLIKFSIKKKIPILGICRGAQAINLHFGGKILKVKNHVRKNHRIFGPIAKKEKIYTNSYHDYGIIKKSLAKNFYISGYSSDEVIESFYHKKFKILCIMWHPERYRKIRKFDKKIIKNFLS